MYPIHVTKTLIVASTTKIALNQTTAGAAALTLNGASATNGVATLDTQRRVLFTDGGDNHLITYTITGTNEYNTVISEVVQGTSSGSTATVNDYLTVTSIVTSGATSGGGVSVGTNTVGSTSWLSVSSMVTPVNINIVVQQTSGSSTFQVEWTPQNIVRIGNLPYVVPTGQVLSLSNGVENITWAVSGVRFTVLTGTGTAEMWLAQSGVAQGG